MTEKLRREFIELLEKDEEFRYTVAGYLGLSEILKELKNLREGQEKLWDNSNRLWESNNRLWEEVRGLREDQRRLWENQEKLWEEVRSLREGQNKLWEGHNRLWEEVRSLREGQEKLWEEMRRMRGYMLTAFSELKSALGVTFEMHAAAYIELILYEMGYEGAKVEKKHILHEGEVLEIDIFSEDPLVVGEVTASLKDAASASREVEKLLTRVRIVEEKYGRKPLLAVLSVATASKQAAEKLAEDAERHGFRLVLGREIEEALQI
ncbi:MAG: hypothetical protein QXN77_07365 [Candidatus Caldarchaeum sp.]